MTKYLTEDELRAMLEPAKNAAPVGSFWTHSKSGEDYVVECIGLSEGGQEPVVGYRNINSDVIWFRVARDFLDGRFQRRNTTHE